MWENYIFKTIISFISLNAVIFITKDNWNKLNPKKNNFIKVLLNRLCFCLIPVFRWFWVAFILIIGIALGNDEFVNKYKNKIGDDK